MTARSIPEAPTFTTQSEYEVWHRLVTQLRPQDVVIANLQLVDGHQDHEIDLLVLMPDVGVMVVEVKGGSLFCKGIDWYQLDSYGERRVTPITQALGNKFAVRRYIESDPRWRRQRVRMQHCLVAPYTDFAPNFAMPDCPRASVHGVGDQRHLGTRLREIMTHDHHGGLPPSADDVELIVEILQGRFLPTRQVTADADERGATADRLTLEQAMLLRATRMLHRVEIRGAAGSGKTVLALTQAKSLTRGQFGAPPQRVALLCYSIGLAEYLKREVQAGKRKDRPAFVGTFAELGRSWGAPDGDRTDSDFWERRLPEQMAELAGRLPDEQRFDAIIVDEAQDFADGWWHPLLRALRDEERSGLYVYSDENQRVFNRFGTPPVTLVPLMLDRNLRNTRQIATTFAPLAPGSMQLGGLNGPPVTFVASSAEDAVAVADDQIDLLLEDGWQPQDVMLLTTGSRHPVQAERQRLHNQVGYWKSFWDNDDIFYGHVLGCKGLERRVVVLCVNETTVRERSRERLYVGLSRATDKLVVVGDLAVITAMAGDDVAAQLSAAAGQVSADPGQSHQR